jgi:uncharacterized protein (DUF488 family)
MHKSFHNYADYAMSGNFRAGLFRLREMGHAQCCAVMCAEVVWWQCHRRIIADYLSFPKIPSAADSRREAESSHHSDRCL